MSDVFNFIVELILVRTLHRECLTRAGLPVCKDAHIFTIEARLNERLDFFEDFCLVASRSEDPIDNTLVSLVLCITELQTCGQVCFSRWILAANWTDFDTVLQHVICWCSQNSLLLTIMHASLGWSRRCLLTNLIRDNRVKALQRLDSTVDTEWSFKKLDHSMLL